MERVTDTDHDLLVTLHEKVRAMQVTLAEVRDGIAVKVADHEIRIRKLEFWGALAVGGLYVLNALLGIFIYLFMHYPK